MGKDNTEKKGIQLFFPFKTTIYPKITSMGDVKLTLDSITSF